MGHEGIPILRKPRGVPRPNGNTQQKKEAETRQGVTPHATNRQPDAFRVKDQKVHPRQKKKYQRHYTRVRSDYKEEAPNPQIYENRVGIREDCLTFGPPRHQLNDEEDLEQGSGSVKGEVSECISYVIAPSDEK